MVAGVKLSFLVLTCLSFVVCLFIVSYRSIQVQSVGLWACWQQVRWAVGKKYTIIALGVQYTKPLSTGQLDRWSNGNHQLSICTCRRLARRWCATGCLLAYTVTMPVHFHPVTMPFHFHPVTMPFHPYDHSPSPSV